MLQMSTSDVIALITVIIIVLSGAVGLGVRWAKSQSTQDQSKKQLEEHKKDCAKEFKRVKDRIDALEEQRSGRHRKSGDILNELAKLIERKQPRKQPRRSATESDDDN